MVHRRHPEVARMMVGGLARGAASCFTAVRGCVQSLVDVGFEPPEWESLLVDARPQSEEEEDPTRRLVGRRKGYHKLNNIVCRLSFGRPCLNLSGPSGVLIQVHWPLWSSWLCHQDHQN